MGETLASWHPAYSGLIGGFVATILTLIPQQTRTDCHGWKKIGPGIMHWIGFGLSAPLTIFMSVLAIHDPMGAEDFQRDPKNVIAFYGILVFLSGCAVLFGYLIRRIRKADVEWLGAQIAFTTPDGQTRFCLMTHAAAIKPSSTGYDVTFFDGTVLKLDQYAKGTEDLCRAIIEINDDDHGGDDRQR